jgi:TfoX/Sxy family transcriptional regulator of competence genes
MTYDEGLAERIRATMDHLHGVAERKMFGGVAFMMRGHMAAGVVKDELMVRVGPEACDRLIDKPHARAMDFTGRVMKGFLFVEPAGLEKDHDLAHWVGLGVEYALSLPPKSALEARPPRMKKSTRPGNRKRSA